MEDLGALTIPQRYMLVCWGLTTLLETMVRLFETKGEVGVRLLRTT
jgi:hypothetical protein